METSMGACIGAFLLAASAAGAGLPLSDTGEVALNGTAPVHADDVTTGGWSYDHAPLGSHYGVYHSGAAHDGALGIRLQGHGTRIASPAFTAAWGTGRMHTRIVDSTGGVPDPWAMSELFLYSGDEYVRLGCVGGGRHGFGWRVHTAAGDVSGELPNVTSDNTNWWTYTIELTAGGEAVFSVDDGATSSSVRVAHGIAGDFTHYVAEVDRWSTGWEVATADYDNLHFIPEPAALTVLWAAAGSVLVKRRRRH